MAKNGTPKKVGRPSDYTPEIGKRICDMLYTTPMTLKQICKTSDDFPADPSTIYYWLASFKEFSDLYDQARQKQADVRADGILDIAWDCDASNASEVNKARLIIDSTKWINSKVMPKKYGDAAKKEPAKNEHEQRLEQIGDE
jgi:hypothetical protein